MRQQGTLKQWNTEKGFGFIQPDDGGNTMFIHISAFPKNGISPRVGEKIRYGISAGKDGKSQASAIERLDFPATSYVAKSSPAKKSTRHGKASPAYGWSSVLKPLVLLLVIIGGYTYYHNNQSVQPFAESTNPASLNNPFESESVNQAGAQADSQAAPQQTTTFRCDGRQHCSQMSSRDEAVFFINNCPETKMDGDNDGDPCEEQFQRIF